LEIGSSGKNCSPSKESFPLTEFGSNLSLFPKGKGPRGKGDLKRERGGSLSHQREEGGI